MNKPDYEREIERLCVLPFEDDGYIPRFFKQYPVYARAKQDLWNSPVMAIWVTQTVALIAIENWEKFDPERASVWTYIIKGILPNVVLQMYELQRRERRDINAMGYETFPTSRHSVRASSRFDTITAYDTKQQQAAKEGSPGGYLSEGVIVDAVARTFLMMFYRPTEQKALDRIYRAWRESEMGKMLKAHIRQLPLDKKLLLILEYDPRVPVAVRAGLDDEQKRLMTNRIIDLMNIKRSRERKSLRKHRSPTAFRKMKSRAVNAFRSVIRDLAFRNPR